jgi:D-beta-D-heptose 7-phosphate kinase/D-beta-D-heptose 1-phosphate adenosyltransferase
VSAASRSGKVVGWEDALAWRQGLAADGRKVVFTNGCFDLLHRGHVELFRAARAEGDALVVGLNGDASMRRLKGATRPLVPLEDRADVLAALEMVDRIVLFDDDTPARLIDALVPDVLVKGADWAQDAIVGRETVERAGGRVVRVNLTEGRSTRALIAKIVELGTSAARASAQEDS